MDGEGAADDSAESAKKEVATEVEVPDQGVRSAEPSIFWKFYHYVHLDEHNVHGFAVLQDAV